VNVSVWLVGGMVMWKCERWCETCGTGRRQRGSERGEEECSACFTVSNRPGVCEAVVCGHRRGLQCGTHAQDGWHAFVQPFSSSQPCMFSAAVAARFSFFSRFSRTKFKSWGKESKTCFFESFSGQKIILGRTRDMIVLWKEHGRKEPWLDDKKEHDDDIMWCDLLWLFCTCPFCSSGTSTNVKFLPLCFFWSTTECTEWREERCVWVFRNEGPSAPGTKPFVIRNKNVTFRFPKFGSGVGCSDLRVHHRHGVTFPFREFFECTTKTERWVCRSN